MTYRGVAELLSAAGRRVGVFGSMNLNYTTLDGYYIPDPWDTLGRTHPAAYAPFYDFVAAQIQESSRPALPAGSAAKFIAYMLRNGLSRRTIAAIVRQLVAERRDPGIKWRRAIVLDLLQYDLFVAANRRHDVKFASFFSNSTAHFQHWHWRNMEPGAFDVQPASYRAAIRTGYRDGCAARTLHARLSAGEAHLLHGAEPTAV